MFNKIIKGFKKNKKVLLYALCGSGKTVITLAIIEKWIKEGKRIAISAYARREIRDQWYDTIKKCAPYLIKHVQFVCASSEINDFIRAGYKNVVCNGNVNPKTPITIFIPQSIDINSNLGKFDYIVIDEAHEYLEVENKKGDGELVKIMNTYSKKTTKYLGLSGTGFELLRKNKFFESCNEENNTLVLYDVVDGMRDNAIVNCEARVEFFRFDIPEDCYNKSGDLKSTNKSLNKWKHSFFKKDNLNKKGKKLLGKEAAFFSFKIENIIKEFNKKNQKVLIILPSGLSYEVEMGVAHAINTATGNERSAVVKTLKSVKDNTQRSKNEERFRQLNSGTNFMVVVGMCGTGWDYRDLDAVIDLSLTRNPKVMIQRMARAIRTGDKKEKKLAKYVYVVDQAVDPNKAQYYLVRAMMLTARRQIISGDINSVYEELIRKKKIKLDSLGNPDSISPITYEDIGRYDTGQQKMFGRKITMADIAKYNSDDSLRVTFITAMIEMCNLMTDDHKKQFNKILEKCHTQLMNDEQILTTFKKELKDVYLMTFGKTTPKKIIKEMTNLKEVSHE